MNRKRALIIIIILFTSLFPLIPIPIAKASSITVSISHSYDDVWMTEAGNIFSNTFMVMILDNEIGIHSFLRFQNLSISKSAKINYATLKIYVAETQETPDLGSSVTIYGIDEPDCAPFTSDGSLWSLSRPYTSASVNWNTTDWAGYRSVNVTDIVKEIINQYAWEFGNDLGLQILGGSDSGQWPRSFEDYYHAYHEGQAQLTIVYDVAPGTPDGLPDTAEFVETYGEYDIWGVPIMDYNRTSDYVYWQYSATVPSINYDTVHPLPSEHTVVEYPLTDTVSLISGGARQITRTENGSIYVVYHVGTNGYIEHSNDEGNSWIGKTKLNTLGGLNAKRLRIAVDSDDTLHVIWQGYRDPDQSIWYVNYTGSWSDPIGIITVGNMTAYGQIDCALAVDEWDNLHVTWVGSNLTFPTAYNAVWYVNRTDVWSDPVRVSTLAGMEDDLASFPTITVDSNNVTHIAWVGFSTAYPDPYTQIWHSYTYSNNSWSNPVRVSTLAGMEDEYQNLPSIASGFVNDNVHLVWDGKDDVWYNFFSIWYSEFLDNGTWSAPYRVSNAGSMGGQHQLQPTIGVYPDETMWVLWSGIVTDNVLWGREYDEGWQSCIRVQEEWTYDVTYPNLAYSRFPTTFNYTYEYFLVDVNNTLIKTWNGENCTSLDCIKDWTDDYTGTGKGDPLDPDPGTQGWDTEGPFTRFKMRLYFLFIGLGCLFIPIWAMAYKKFDAVGYTWCFLIMVLGVGLLWSITGI